MSLFSKALNWVGDGLADIGSAIVDGVSNLANWVVGTVSDSGLGESVGQLVGDATGINAQNDANRNFQLQLQNQANQFTHDERIASQQYQTQERLDMQAWQQNMFDYQQRNGAAMQFSGLVNAGINPNAAVAALGGGSAPSAPATSAPSGEVVGAPQIAPQTPVFEGMAAITNALSQAKLNQSMAAKSNQERRLLVIDEHTRPILNEEQIAEIRGRTQSYIAQGRLSDVEANQIETLLPALVGKSYAEIDAICADIDSKYQAIKEMQANTDLLRQKIDESKAAISKMTAEEYEAWMSGDMHKSAIELNGHQMSLFDAERYLKELQSKGQELDNTWTETLHGLGLDGHANDVANAASFFVTNRDTIVELINGLKTPPKSVKQRVKESFTSKGTPVRPIASNTHKDKDGNVYITDDDGKVVRKYAHQ